MANKRKSEHSLTNEAMATNTKKGRAARRYELPIQFMDFTEQAMAQPSAVTYQLTDVSDEATVEHQGKSIKLTKSMLIDIQSLGAGQYAEAVIQCEVQGHPELQMAVKKLPLVPSERNPDDFTTYTDLRTIRQVGSGENIHVTKFIAALADRKANQLIICMELCDASMDRFAIQMHKMRRTDHLDVFLKRLIDHMVDALQYLKTKNLLHRDVKPSNILINRRPLCFKLCDFGICGIMIQSVALTMNKGTKIYLAPERIDRTRAPNGYGIRSDMWALGLSALEIADNRHPFDGLEPIGISQVLKTWRAEVVNRSLLSKELIDLMDHLLAVEHEQRPATYRDILSSPAMQSLPRDVTPEEYELVDAVIPAIPPYSLGEE